MSTHSRRWMNSGYIMHGVRHGLTVIEVLVALTLLGVVSAAIIGSFSALVSVNRDVSAEVDVGRIARTISETTVNQWRLLDNWNAGSVSGDLFDEYVRNVSDVANEGTPLCTGSFEPEVGVPTVVRTLTIDCVVSASGNTARYVFQVGAP